MKKSFAIIGLGRFGTSLAIHLFEMGQEVLAVDIENTKVEAIKDHVTVAAQADLRDERALSQLGVQNFDAVIISIGGDVQSSIMATVLCKELGARMIIAKAADALHAKLLKKVGADKILMTEREAGARLARSLVSESLIDYLELSDQYSVSEIAIPSKWVGHSLNELRVRNIYDISVIAICRDESILVKINPKEDLRVGDILVVIGENKDISNIMKL